MVLNQDDAVSYIANETWELSKVTDVANQLVFLQMYLMIKYVLDAQNLVLRIELRRNKKLWDIVCYSNRNYVGDPFTRRGIIGFILCNSNVPVS